MKTSNRAIGNYGEQLAVEYLLSKGYSIAERNYSCKLGEIDIIARQGEYIVFVEVKYRADSRYGFPLEAVTPTKQRKLKNTAKLYLVHTNQYGTAVRFDIVDICDNKGEPTITHIENAF